MGVPRECLLVPRARIMKYIWGRNNVGEGLIDPLEMGAKRKERPQQGSINELVMRLGNWKWRRRRTGALAHLFPWSDLPASTQRTSVGVGTLDKVMEG